SARLGLARTPRVAAMPRIAKHPRQLARHVEREPAVRRQVAERDAPYRSGEADGADHAAAVVAHRRGDAARLLVVLRVVVGHAFVAYPLDLLAQLVLVSDGVGRVGRQRHALDLAIEYRVVQAGKERLADGRAVRRPQHAGALVHLERAGTRGLLQDQHLVAGPYRKVGALAGLLGQLGEERPRGVGQLDLVGAGRGEGEHGPAEPVAFAL